MQSFVISPGFLVKSSLCFSNFSHMVGSLFWYQLGSPSSWRQSMDQR